MVLKPAETTPLTALKLAEIIQQADLPPGVVNIITGAGSTGASIVNHKDLNKIAFTGSTEIGKIIQKAVAGTGKKLTLELGGKSANIIFEDAAIDQAVEGVVNAIFFNQGHVCCAGSRLFVQESVASMVIAKLRDRMESLIVGDPLDKNTDIGAINSKMQLDKINTYLEAGVKEGALMYQNNCPVPKKGYWVRPTLFTDVAQSHKIVQEEIFGPVLTVQTFRTPEEAIEKANNILTDLPEACGPKRVLRFSKSQTRFALVFCGRILITNSIPLHPLVDSKRAEWAVRVESTDFCLT